MINQMIIHMINKMINQMINQVVNQMINQMRVWTRRGRCATWALPSMTRSS